MSLPIAIGEAVILDIITSIRGITVDNGYSFDVGDIVREIPNIPEAIKTFALPAVFVWPGQETFDYKEALTRTYCTLDLNLMLLEQVERDVESSGRRMMYDLLKAVCRLNRPVSHTSGTINARVDAKGMLVFNGLVDANQAGGQLVLEVAYRTRYADPYTKG